MLGAGALGWPRGIVWGENSAAKRIRAPQKLNLRFSKRSEAKAKVEAKPKPRNTESPVVDLLSREQ